MLAQTGYSPNIVPTSLKKEARSKRLELEALYIEEDSLPVSKSFNAQQYESQVDSTVVGNSN